MLQDVVSIILSYILPFYNLSIKDAISTFTFFQVCSTLLAKKISENNGACNMGFDMKDGISGCKIFFMLAGFLAVIGISIGRFCKKPECKTILFWGT